MHTKNGWQHLPNIILVSTSKSTFYKKRKRRPKTRGRTNSSKKCKRPANAVIIRHVPASTQTAGEFPDLDPRVSVSRGASSLLLEFSSDATVLYQGPAAAAKTAGALKVLGLPMESSLAPRTRPGDPRDYLPLAGAASTRVEMFPSPRHAFAVEARAVPAVWRGRRKWGFCRELLHALLLSNPLVRVLDADPSGGSHLSPPRILALKDVRREHALADWNEGSAMRFFGHSSPADEPESYCRALSDLIQAHFDSDPAPLVVVTHHKIKSLHGEILSALAKMIEPTKAFFLSSLPAENHDLEPLFECPLETIQVNPWWIPGPREGSIQNYFQSAFPVEISLDDLALHVHGLEEHDENDRLDAVEGTLVGLCLSPPDPPQIAGVPRTGARPRRGSLEAHPLPQDPAPLGSFGTG